MKTQQTAAAMIGAAAITPTNGTGCPGENASAPAAASPLANPTQAPVPPARTSLCRSDSGRTLAIATRLMAIAIGS